MLGKPGESYLLLQFRLLAEILKYLKKKKGASVRQTPTNYHLCELFIEQLLSNKIL